MPQSQRVDRWSNLDDEEEPWLKAQLRRTEIRRDFGAWCEHALAQSGQSPARHHRLLIKELQAIESGENDRLMIMMPPGSAKSTYASKLFPAHFLARHPGSLIIGASHGQSLADTFSGDVQRLVREHSKALGYNLANEAKDFWLTDNGGAYRAVGTGGSVTGRRASCLPGNAVIQTITGPRTIAEVEIGTETGYVLAYDESKSVPTFGRVTAVVRRKADELYRIRTASGRVVEATGDHRFYTERGWREASALSVGDILLREVRGAWKAPELRSPQKDVEWRRYSFLRSLLRDKSEQRSSRHGRPEDLHRLLVAAEHEDELLFAGMPGDCIATPRFNPAQSCVGSYLRTLRECLSSSDSKPAHECAWPLLFASMQECSACDRNQRGEESRLAQWDEPQARASEGLVSSEDASLGARRLQVCGLWEQRQAGCSPHQHDPVGPSTRELGCSLSRVSPQVSRGGAFETERDPVAVVECLRREEVVYDIEVEGFHNFFANGILVHNCVIWDDPIKGHEEADSQTMRDKAWNWYRSDMVTRLLPGGSIVVISTRWHEDDPCGRLLAEMKAGGDQWRVVNLPAIAEANDPLGRKPGEVLWPEWEDAKAIARKRRVVGERAFASLFQQQPRPAEGAIIRASWWRPWTAPLPPPDMTLISLDLAYTSKETNDPSACTVWDVTTGDDFRSKAVMRFAWAERLEFPELMAALLETVKAYRKQNIPLRVLVEGKGPGLSVIQELRRRMPELNIHQVNPVPDKVARAHAITAMFEQGIVHARATFDEDGQPKFKPWAEMVINECAAFPLGATDDLVDSVTQCLRHIRDLGFELHAEDAPPPARASERQALY